MRNKLKWLASVLVLAVLVGCASVSTNTFRTEQTATDLAYGAYLGWTNYLALQLSAPGVTQARKDVLAEATSEVKRARIQFAATVGTVEALRAAYETNSAMQTPLQAVVSTAVNESSNIVWLINFWRNQ